MKRTAIAVLVMCLALVAAGYSSPLHAAVTSEEEIPVWEVGIAAPLRVAVTREELSRRN
jgi:hypothetical protein